MLRESSSEESNDKKSDEESDYEASESNDDINGDDDDVVLVDKGKSTMIPRRKKSRDDSARNSGISIREPTTAPSILKKRKSDTLHLPAKRIKDRIFGSPSSSSSSSSSTNNASVAVPIDPWLQLATACRDSQVKPSSNPSQVNINGETNTTTSSSSQSSSSIPTSVSRSNLQDFSFLSPLASENTRRSSSSSSVQSQSQDNIPRSSTSSQQQQHSSSSSELSRPRPQRYLMIAPLATDMQQRLYGFIQQPPYLPILPGLPLCIPIVNFDDNTIQTVPGYTRVPLDATTSLCWAMFTNPSYPSLNGFDFVPSLFKGNNTNPLAAVSSVSDSVSGTVPLPAVSSVLGSSVEAQANDTRRWASVLSPELLNYQQQQQNHSYLAPQASGIPITTSGNNPNPNAFGGYTQAQMEAMTRSYRNFHADPSSSNLHGPSFVDSSLVPSFQGNITRPSTVNLHRPISVSGPSSSSSLGAQANVVGGYNSGLLPSMTNDQQQQQHHPSSMDVRGLDLNLPANDEDGGERNEEDEGFDLNLGLG
ncbi:unnamed protein product [Microthlaspi erraticum]|uniref:Uncharacterized protein n=1 Tax=Microthlaspi erraticum TaxID=1685480 RepID=A0A6D2ITY0_9BRAS|nr:unnamed protein product [Microthlaspi erraticum]